MKTHTFAIVGCGKLAHIIADALVKGLLPNYKMIATYSGSFEKAVTIANKIDAEKEGFLYAPIEFGTVAESAERLESLSQTDDHRIGEEGDAGNDAHARNGCIAKRTCCHIEHQRSNTAQSLS